MKSKKRAMIVAVWALAVLGGTATVWALSPLPGAATETLAASKAVFERICSGCHGLDRPLGKTFDQAGWEALVQRMQSNGAVVSEVERAQIVSYLVTKNTFEAKCSACHGIDRPLGKNKGAADWLATVQRMAGKKPGHLTAGEVANIAAYLSLVRPPPQ